MRSLADVDSRRGEGLGLDHKRSCGCHLGHEAQRRQVGHTARGELAGDVTRPLLGLAPGTEASAVADPGAPPAEAIADDVTDLGAAGGLRAHPAPVREAAAHHDEDRRTQLGLTRSPSR